MEASDNKVGVLSVVKICLTPQMLGLAKNMTPYSL
jgi:hypothetical protein